MPFIDWTFLFHAWELRGKYPEILEHARANGDPKYHSVRFGDSALTSVFWVFDHEATAEELTAGDKLPLTLVIEGKDGRRERIDVTAEVRMPGAAAQPGHAH